MAEDGRIIIDTKINSEGIDIGEKEVRNKLSKITKDLDLKVNIETAKLKSLKDYFNDINKEISDSRDIIKKGLKLPDDWLKDCLEYNEAIKSISKNATVYNTLSNSISIASTRLEKLRAEQEAYNRTISQIPKTPKIVDIPNLKNVEWSVPKINTASIDASLEKIRKGIKLKVSQTCDEAKNHVQGLGDALTSMMNKFGRMLIYQALRQMARALIEEIKQGVADLAIFDEQFGRTMQDIKDSFKNMVNSITTFLSPLIATIGKVLKWLFDGITWFINETTKFFGALRGDKYVTIADTNFKNYGKSVEKASKSTRKAKKDTKDMMKSLAKFDKLDILNENKKGSLSNAIGGIGGGATSERNQALDMFKKVDTSAWRKKINDFNKATEKFIVKNFNDFDKWGNDIGEKFNNIGTTLKKDWINIWDNFGKNSGTMFSEFFSGVGDTWNTGWEGLKDSFYNFGKNISKSWEKLKNSCYKTAEELKINSGNIGNDFKNLLESIKKGDWEGVRKNFENLVKNTTDTFEKLKNKASKTWNEFVYDSKSTLNELSKNLNETWEKVKNKWNSTAEQFKNNWYRTWTQFAENSKILFSNLAKSIFEFLASVLKGFVRTILQNTAIGRSIEFVIKGNRHNKEITEKIERGELTPQQALEETKKFNRQLFNLRRIPGLATGTVVSPGREFLARLGDNTREQEIVSPISTMKQAFSEALREYGGGGGAVLQLDGETFARLINPYSKAENNRLGMSMVSGV